MDFVTLEPGLVQQLLYLRARVQEHVTTSGSESHPADRRAPRPVSRKRENRFVGRQLAHLFQHRYRIADVIEEPNAKADVKLFPALISQQVGLYKLANVTQVLLLARFLAQPDHHFSDVD